MSRISMKVTGAQGQGVNSVGEMCGKGLKQAGYCVFGYREYMSLIKGGHSSYQIDVSNKKIESSETMVDILVNFNHHGMEGDHRSVKPGGIILHQTEFWDWPEQEAKWLEKNNITEIYFPTEDILKELKAPAIMGNVLLTSAVWTLFGQTDEGLKALVKVQFGHKGEALLKKNYTAIEKGTAFIREHPDAKPITLPTPDATWSDHLYLTGSVAMGLGAVHAGCRLYAGYPMTPSSPLLSYIAGKQNETNMVIKQAEDEITAAQIMSGAMAAGTRAMTATSGGGFDLMTETVSMNAIHESPGMYVLAQRPGPATGLPTWTCQGDLLLAVGSAHGEFARLVLGVSDSQDSFDLMPAAFNYAEEYQIPVVVLTDKHIAEGLYTQTSYDQTKAVVQRGELVTEQKALDKLSSTDRFDPSVKNGISKRWLPGSKAATFCLQSDEHLADGTVTEDAEMSKQQMDKRMRKMQALKDALPEPIIYGAKKPAYLIVGWGSTKCAVIDAMHDLGRDDIGYLHFEYLWPLKTELYDKLATQAKQVILVEGNYQGQLGMLLKMECGHRPDQQILKYDGRPFFVDELVTLLTPHLS